MTATSDIVATLLNEVLGGPAQAAAYFLNPGDAGLLRSLDRLSAAQASAPAPGGGPSIAAHVEHLRYGLELLNRDLGGGKAFDTADYTASWRRVTVSEPGWMDRREQLRSEARRLQEAVAQRPELNEADLTGVLAMIVHLAYHLGAIRQIDRSTRGPAARD